MKRVLITGAGSYIGTSLAAHLEKFDGEYAVSTLDMQTDAWKNADFSLYDAVVHVAGIAHRKIRASDEAMYMSVNCDLAFETAQKAKTAGVGTFVFLSSMSVYGLTRGHITTDTPCNPRDAYGKSKLAAEGKILPLSDETFCVSCVRPPMVYGKGCRGNYPRLSSLIKKAPFFPDYKNERSMIYIENLCEFLRLLIDRPQSGLHFPQNAEYVSTSDLARLVADCAGKKLLCSKAFNFPVSMGIGFVGTLQKVFGTLVYDKSMSGDLSSYNICTFAQSVLRSEEK